MVDMNLSPRWVAFLGTHGFEAEYWSAVGPGHTPDVEIMAYARANDFVVLTHDLDFGAILAATGGEKPSVVQIRAPSPLAVCEQRRDAADGDAAVGAFGPAGGHLQELLAVALRDEVFRRHREGRR